MGNVKPVDAEAVPPDEPDHVPDGAVDAVPVQYDNVIHAGGDDPEFATANPDFARMVRLLHDTLGPAIEPHPTVGAGVDDDTAQLFPHLPASFSRFEILACVGAGAFGSVWKANDPLLERTVAVKIPHASVRADIGLSRRFLREARAAARLNHPNIIRVLEGGAADGIAYMTAEYVDGEPLSALIRREPMMDCRRAAEIVRDLAAAAHHAHELGVLHRDIKPDNILIQFSTGQAKNPPRLIPRLTDFGLAYIAGEDSAASRAGVMIGTPTYMAPEQFVGTSTDHGPFTDVYSLGIVLYELLVGRLPIDHESTLAAALDSASRRLEPPRRLRHDIPRDLDTICRKCVERDPRDRYQSAGELDDDLDRFLSGRPTIARPLPLNEQFTRWFRENRLTGSTLMIVLVSLFAVAAMSMYLRQVESRQNVELQNALTDAQSARRDAEQSELRFRELAWGAGLQRAYALHEDGDFPGTAHALAALRQSHPNAPGRIEWSLLQAELASEFRVIHAVDYALREVVRIAGTTGIAFGGDDETLSIINLSTGIASQIDTGLEDIQALASRPDGRQLAVGGSQNSLAGCKPVLVDPESRSAHTLDFAGETTIESLAYSPDGSQLAVGCRYRPVAVVGLASTTQAEVVRLPGDRRNRSVAWLSNTGHVVAQQSREILLISKSDGQPVGRVEQSEGFVAFCNLPPTGDILAANYYQDALSIIRSTDGRTIQKLVSNGTGIKCVAASEDGTWAAAGLIDGQVVVWNLSDDPSQTTGEGDEPRVRRPFSIARVHEGEVSSLCWSGSQVLSAGVDGRIVAFDVRSETLRRQGFLHAVTTACFLGPQDSVVLGMRDGAVYRVNAARLYELTQDSADNAQSIEFVKRIGAFEAAVSRVAASIDGSLIGIGTVDGAVHIVRALDGSAVATFPGPGTEDAEETPVLSIVFSRNGNRICWTGRSRMHCVSLDNLHKSWDTEFRSDAEFVCLTPDETIVAVGGLFEGLARFRHSNGEPIASLGLQAIRAAVFSQDQVVTGEADGTIRVYSAPTAAPQTALRVHPLQISRVVMPDAGCAGLSIDAHSRICLWNGCAGAVYGRLQRTAPVTEMTIFRPDLSLSRDGRWLLAITNKSPNTDRVATVRVYDLHPAPRTREWRTRSPSTLTIQAHGDYDVVPIHTNRLLK